MFDFRLKVFYTVANKLSFTKAAQELFITQPAVTKHIHELESQLGQTLIERNGKVIELTAAGKILADSCKRIFSIYGELEFELAQLKGKAAGSLRIGASTTISQYILPAILAEFSQKHNTVRISVIDGNSEYIEQQLQDDKIDIAIVEGSSKKSFLHYAPFAEDELVLVTNTSKKQKQKEEITLQQLVKLPLVVREFGSGTLEILQQALQQQRIKPDDLNIILRLGTTEGIKQYLLHSNAYAFISIYAVLNEIKAGTLQVIEIKDLRINRMLQFVHTQGQPSALSSLFMRFCKRQHRSA
ncbi:MAG: LysR family transcriptional regulator [Filimonas sp.]|nr:LysR family transcriptional regulator [Filimonas sp.]